MFGLNSKIGFGVLVSVILVMFKKLLIFDSFLKFGLFQCFSHEELGHGFGLFVGRIHPEEILIQLIIHFDSI